ncbi:hypothetical protein MPLSOD_50166 [Mesorhizobium sp. SOD10]|nr:hypothetical protein MPLSOD_50166 [Mesorhizobium sp. SOD10]
MSAYALASKQSEIPLSFRPPVLVPPVAALHHRGNQQPTCWFGRHSAEPYHANAAEIVVDTLIDGNVEAVMGLPGDGIRAPWEALRKSGTRFSKCAMRVRCIRAQTGRVAGNPGEGFQMSRTFAWAAAAVIVLILVAVWAWTARDSRRPPGQQPPPHAINQNG